MFTGSSMIKIIKTKKIIKIGPLVYELDLLLWKHYLKKNAQW